MSLSSAAAVITVGLRGIRCLYVPIKFLIKLTLNIWFVIRKLEQFILSLASIK